MRYVWIPVLRHIPNSNQIHAFLFVPELIGWQQRLCKILIVPILWTWNEAEFGDNHFTKTILQPRIYRVEHTPENRILKMFRVSVTEVPFCVDQVKIPTYVGSSFKASMRQFSSPMSPGPYWNIKQAYDKLQRSHTQ